MLKPALAATLFLGAALALPAPAQQPADTIRRIVIFGNDRCPQGVGDEIIICARRPEAERGRYPADPNAPLPGPGSQSWKERAEAIDNVADAGIGSCSASGPGGASGCLKAEIDRNEALKDAARDAGPER